MDPFDYFMWDEFIGRDTEYECPECGAHFGVDCLARNDEDGSIVYQCPECGHTGVIEE